MGIALLFTHTPPLLPLALPRLRDSAVLSWVHCSIRGTVVAAGHMLSSAELGQLRSSLDHAALSVLTSVALCMIWSVRGRLQWVYCAQTEAKGKEGRWWT